MMQEIIFAALHNTLQKNVYGQHLMLDIVTRALRGHLSSSNPAKALVLSFHGTTGSGKSYVSQFIAESIFKEGMSSKFVKKYVAGIDFPDHSPSMNAIYKVLVYISFGKAKKCSDASYKFFFPLPFSVFR